MCHWKVPSLSVGGLDDIVYLMDKAASYAGPRLEPLCSNPAHYIIWIASKQVGQG